MKRSYLPDIGIDFSNMIRKFGQAGKVNRNYAAALAFVWYWGRYGVLVCSLGYDKVAVGFPTRPDADNTDTMCATIACFLFSK